MAVILLALGNVPVGLRFAGVDDIGELDSILNEEYLDRTVSISCKAGR
jgi:hypothetical protein